MFFKILWNIVFLIPGFISLSSCRSVICKTQYLTLKKADDRPLQNRFNPTFKSTQFAIDDPPSTRPVESYQSKLLFFRIQEAIELCLTHMYLCCYLCFRQLKKFLECLIHAAIPRSRSIFRTTNAIQAGRRSIPFIKSCFIASESFILRVSIIPGSEATFLPSQ